MLIQVQGCIKAGYHTDPADPRDSNSLIIRMLEWHNRPALPDMNDRL
jgi:hypothetical protein